MPDLSASPPRPSSPCAIKPSSCSSAERPSAAVSDWGHVTSFSPWRYVVDDGARQLLEATGWAMPDLERDPTGRELIDHYLAPLAAHPAIAPHLRLGAGVVSVTRRGMDRVPSTGREIDRSRS